MTAPLPIDPLLPEIVQSLRRIPNLVLGAPPGAGKTTRVPPALLDGGLVPSGEILVSGPRRMAARAAARRVAAERGVALGQEVGYRVRMDARAGPATRLTFVTEGILLRRLQVDPELGGVDVVVLDEFHERSLQADLSLALLAEVQRELRPELRILVMSATLEATPLAAYLGDCPVLEAQGRAHPIQIQHVEQPDHRPLAVRVAGALARALEAPQDDGGHLLAFLPGAAEIRRVADLLAGVAQRHCIRVMPLHGNMDARAQDAALAPGGGRKLILATNVAETSLTIDGVTTVVDSGLVKQLRHDPRFGLDRLVLVDISRASATQRAGRAGRTAPGRVIRLWTRGEHHGRPERERAEVGRVDLAGAVLQLRAWGCAEPADFPWFEPPPAASLERADRLLGRLGAVDRAGVTPLGRRMLTAGLHPRLARMLVAASDAGWLHHGALLAALASEPDVLSAARVFGEPSGASVSAAEGIVGASDLLWRLDRIIEAGRLGDAALRSQGLDPRATRRVLAVARQLAAAARATLSDGRSTLSSVEPTERDLLGLLLLGYPDRVALRRRAGGSRVLLDGGREADLDPTSVVREGTLLLAHRVEDGARGRAARVRLASQISAELLAEVLPGSVRAETVLAFDEETQRVVAEHQRRFGTLVVERRTVPVEDRAAAGELVAQAACRAPRQALGWGPEVDQWLARVRFAAHHLPEAGFPRFDDDALKALTGELCLGRLSFDELRRVDLLSALGGRLGRPQVALLDREVPDGLTVPSGSRIRLVYGACEDPPVLAVRIQEIFGLAETPRVARGRVAVLLHLLAPNQRPAQVTQDLESFWDRGYHEVRKELAGRYPKHAWPADPRAARATRRTRRSRK